MPDLDPDPFDSVMETRDVSTFAEFEQWLLDIGANGTRIAFRGQANSEWYLTTSLERFVLSVHIGPQANVRNDFRHDISVSQPWIEDRLTSEFKRGAHHFNVEPVDKDDAFGWLALMQHHGAPTRLLDWTESPYVALYFATEPMTATTPAVFAINIDVLEAAVNERWNATASPDTQDAINCLGPFGMRPGTPEERTESLNAFLREHRESGLAGVVAARPFKMNQRLTLQRGLFLVPLSLNYSLEGQLATLLSSYPHDKALFRARFKGFERRSVVVKLEEMNIHPASLFPGLDGYAQSLKRRYEIQRLNDLI